MPETIAQGKIEHVVALHAAALTTKAGGLHEPIDKLENELQADLLLVEHEAKWVKDKIFK